MGFHEVRFPEDISYGSKGGPGFNTGLVEMDGGQVQAVPRWDEARHRFDCAWGIKTPTQLTTLKTFYMARQGSAHGFRYKDWADYTTHPTDGSDTGTDPTDQPASRATSTQYQLTKEYTSGGVTRVRRITKPVNGTVTVYADGIAAPAHTINYATGIVTFSVDPGVSVDITWGGQFDVPVYFEKEVDDLLSMSFDDFQIHSSAGGIQLAELMDPGTSIDEFFYGGAADLCLSASYTWSVGAGRFLVVSPQVAGLSIILPDESTIPPGGPVLVVCNIGPESIDIDWDDGSTLVTVASGQMVEVWVGVDIVGAHNWYAF